MNRAGVAFVAFIVLITVVGLILAVLFNLGLILPEKVVTLPPPSPPEPVMPLPPDGSMYAFDGTKFVSSRSRRCWSLSGQISGNNLQEHINSCARATSLGSGSPCVGFVLNVNTNTVMPCTETRLFSDRIQDPNFVTNQVQWIKESEENKTLLEI